MAEQSASTPAAAALRELLRTPAVRELIQLNLSREDLAGEARQLTRALLQQDVDLALSLASQLPGALNAWVAVVSQLGELLERTPPALADQLLEQMLRGVDHEALVSEVLRLGRLIHTLAAVPDSAAAARLARQLADGGHALCQQWVSQHGENPAQPVAPLATLMLALLPVLDSGVLRQGGTALARSAGEALPPVLERLASDPVAMANLLGLLPPLINAALELQVRTLAAVRLPPEVLASAALTLLQELDPARLAGLLDQAARLLLALHEGSQVLGQHEPRLKPVLLNLAQELLSRVDRQQAAQALVALAEDGETVLQVASVLLRRDPGLLTLLLATGGAALETLLRGAADTLTDLGQLPPDTLRRAAEEAQLSRLVPQAARLGRLLTPPLQDALRRWLPDLVTEDLARQLGQALADRPELLRAFAGPLMRNLRSLLWQSLRSLLPGLPRRPRGRAR